MLNKPFRVGAKATCEALAKAELISEGVTWSPLEHAAFRMYRDPRWSVPPICIPHEPRGTWRSGMQIALGDTFAGECGA